MRTDRVPAHTLRATPASNDPTHAAPSPDQVPTADQGTSGPTDAATAAPAAGEAKPARRQKKVKKAGRAKPGTPAVPDQPVSKEAKAEATRVATRAAHGLAVPLLLAIRDGEWHALGDLVRAKDFAALIPDAEAEAAAGPARPGRPQAQHRHTGRLRITLAAARLVAGRRQAELEKDAGQWRVRLAEPLPDGRFEFDPELEGLLPPLAQDEMLALEAALLRREILPQFHVWERGGKEDRVLLGDMVQARIYSKYHLRTPSTTWPRIVVTSVSSRAEAEAWIIRRLVQRQHLSPAAISYLRGRRYNTEKRPGARSDLAGTSAQNEQRSEVETDRRLGVDFGVSPATIRRDGTFAAALDALATVAEATEGAGAGRRLKGLAIGRDARVRRPVVLRLAGLEQDALVAAVRELLRTGLPPAPPGGQAGAPAKERATREAVPIKLIADDPAAAVQAMARALDAAQLKALMLALRRALKDGPGRGREPEAEAEPGESATN